METKEVVLSNGKTVKVRGRTSWEILDRKEQPKKSEGQLDICELCVIEPKLTRDELRDLLAVPIDLATVDRAIFDVENPKSDFPESQLQKK